jgi:ABC-type transporter Mla maintaining outer membrane lipid asymmetry ATPase subunit MlaF
MWMRPEQPSTMAVSADNLRVSRGGREVLHGLTFAVDRGSVTGLLGPNGAGPPHFGRVRQAGFEDVDVRLTGE